MKKEFFKYVLPSMLAFAFSGVYAIVDGFFVGRNIGDAGLAAINLAYPITALLQSAGTGIGMGGAIHIAISIGAKNDREKDRFFQNTIGLLIASCLVMTAVLYLAAPGLLHLFGAQGEIFDLALEYIRYIILGATCQILGTGLVPIIRNFNGAFLAMAAMIAGFVTNILLDWAFVSVFQWGMMGAAVATVIGQFVTAVPCVVFLLVHGHFKALSSFRVSGLTLRKIVAVGASPFGLTLSPNIILMLMNKSAVDHGGNAAVSAYAVVSYVVCIIQLLLQGVGDGCQPLISRYHGQGHTAAVRAHHRTAYWVSVVTALFAMLGIYLLRGSVSSFFGASAQVGKTVEEVLPIFLLGFLFVGFSRVTISYLYAVKQNLYAYLLIYGEPVLLFLLLNFVFPPMLNLLGVWISVPVTQAVIALVGTVLLWCYRRKLPR